MSNCYWSLEYLIPSIKLKEDKRAKPFYHEEEEEDGGGATYKRLGLKIKRESYSLPYV
jgi:hypothetical protein